MNLRPRCREWLPLATQQLRLRNLARIQGLNIECMPSHADASNDEVFIYYTLHADKASEAFYSSEALPQRHQQQKWAEICAGDVWRKSNAQCMCVKVWARYQPAKRTPKFCETEGTTATAAEIASTEPQSALTQRLANDGLKPHNLPRPPEHLLFCWGIYLSGLIPLASSMLSKCHPNCLIFQLNGEYFTSPAMIRLEGLHDKLHLNYQRYAAENIELQDDSMGINSPPVSRSSSPVLNNSGQAERELLRMASARYMEIFCVLTDVRRSYNLDQLLQLQRLQRSKQQSLQLAADVCKEVARLSMHCITRNELRYKPRTTSLSSSPFTTQHLNHSMGRKLSILLSEQQEIAPLTLYNAQRLSQQIEALRCKRRLLEAERETFIKCNERHKERLHQLRQSRVALQQQLEMQRRQLEKRRLDLMTRMQEYQTQRNAKQQINRQMERRMSTLVLELQEIYNIHSLDTNQFSICGIVFPHMEQYSSDTRQISNAQLMENVSPLAVSAALGYVAHLVQMLAIIMDKPLRNPILYEPSRTRIIDVIKKLPGTTREFPLYTRSILPSPQTKYAIYLLRQNVAQLSYDITGSRDLSNTFGSLLEIFQTLRGIERSQRELSSEPMQEDELDGNKGMNGLTVTSANQQLSESHSSIDMNHVPLPTTVTTAKDALLQLLPPPGVSQALSIEGYASTQRICRSVGSYSDGEEDFRSILEHTYSNSDSKITLQTERS